ncbi:MAG: VanW family protein [Acidimicrobiales bacterium]
MRRPRLRLVLGIAIPLLVVVTLLAAWAIDTSSANGKVPRNVTLAGRDVSRLPEDELASTVADIAKTYDATEVQVRTPGQTYKVAASKLGLRLDTDATVQAAVELDQGQTLGRRPLVWLESFLAKRKAPLRFTVDAGALDLTLASLAGNSAATEPSVVPTGNGFGIISGSRGRRITGNNIRGQLLDRARSGERPIVVEAKAVDRAPLVSDEVARQAADKLSLTTAKGLVVTAGARRAQISAATVRSWVRSTVKANALVTSVDPAKVTRDLVAALPDVTKTRNAAITLVNNAVQILPSADGERCCAPDTPARVLAAINAGTGAVDVQFAVEKAAFTTEAAVKLRIKEPVGTLTVWKGQPQVKSFTTYYDPAGGPRVVNIHRIADLVRGTIVKPGKTFSVNGTVGPRTEAKGFVLAGAIADGEHTTEVGGGVSQFATTMFNAAFFAGLDITTYQAHSEYFDRYPFGREATMGLPNPDLKWKNNTPYGILIWTSFTDSSVTVTLWSTQYAYGEQTGQTQGRSGRCTTVSTQRTVRLPGGKTTTDSFGARYRPTGSPTC